MPPHPVARDTRVQAAAGDGWLRSGVLQARLTSEAVAVLAKRARLRHLVERNRAGDTEVHFQGPFPPPGQRTESKRGIGPSHSRMTCFLPPLSPPFLLVSSSVFDYGCL